MSSGPLRALIRLGFFVGDFGIATKMVTVRWPAVGLLANNHTKLSYNTTT